MLCKKQHKNRFVSSTSNTYSNRESYPLHLDLEHLCETFVKNDLNKDARLCPLDFGSVSRIIVKKTREFQNLFSMRILTADVKCSPNNFTHNILIII